MRKLIDQNDAAPKNPNKEAREVSTELIKIWIVFMICSPFIYISWVVESAKEGVNYSPVIHVVAIVGYILLMLATAFMQAYLTKKKEG